MEPHVTLTISTQKQTHSQYLPMTGSKLWPPVFFCKAGIASEAGEQGLTPELVTMRASQVMMWSAASTLGHNMEQ